MDAGKGTAGRVIVVGSINLDLVLRMPRLPRAGETVTGGTLARHHGGKGANQAVAAARAGADAYLVGAVGEDDGQACIDALAAEGVDVSAVARLRGLHTGHAVVIVDAEGENQIAVAPGANTAVTPGHVLPCLGALRVGRRDVIAVSFELPDPPLLAAAAAAREVGATLIVNPAPARECEQELLRGAVLTPNRRELAAMVTCPEGSRTGSTTGAGPATAGPGGIDGDVRRAASMLSRCTAAAVVATLGKDGALLAEGTSVEYFPGHLMTARDTTGAGDTLTGVLGAGLAAGSDLRTALRRAIAAAALAVTRAGAREGMPGASEIDALLARDG